MIAAFSLKEGQAKTVNKLIFQCKEVTGKILENDKKKEEENNRGPKAVRMRNVVEGDRDIMYRNPKEQYSLLVKE